MNSEQSTVRVKKDPVKNDRKHKHLTKSEKIRFAKELLVNKMNKRKAYQAIRPVTDEVGRVRGTQLSEDKVVIKTLRDTLRDNDLDIDNVAKYLKIAITSGLGKKATNKDSISGLKILTDVYQNKENDDLEALHEADLREQSHAELSKQLDNIVKEIKQLKREGAEEGEIVQ